MKEDWLDKSLENKLDNYDSPMDLENAWGALQARREKPKKKKRFFFWLFFGLLTIGIGAWGSYFIFNQQSDVVLDERQTTASKTAIQIEKQNENAEKAFEKTTATTPVPADVEKTDFKKQVEQSVSHSLKTSEENINSSDKWKRGNQNYSHPTEEATLSSVATSSENEETIFSKIA